mgnify:FL=1
MDDPLAGALRQSVEAWEREVAAYWNDVSRSPEFLTRVGRQLSASLRSQQHIRATLQAAAWNLAAARQERARELAALAQLEARLDALAARLDRLERQVGDG